MKLWTWNWNSTRSNLSSAWSWETGSCLGPWRCRESLGSSRTWGILRGNHPYRLTCSPCDSCDLQRCGASLPSQVKVSLKSGNKKNETDDRRDHEARSFCRYLGFLHGLTCPQPGAGGWGHDWGHGSVKEV